jgi:hypothetical protein
MDYLLLGIFLGLALLGVPVAYALCLSAATVILLLGKPLVSVTQYIFAGVDSFSFYQVPSILRHISLNRAPLKVAVFQYIFSYV